MSSDLKSTETDKKDECCPGPGWDGTTNRGPLFRMTEIFYL